MILNSLFLRSSFDGRFKSVQEHCKVFFYVHLFKNIYRVAFPVFKCMAIAFRIAIHFFTEEKSAEESLPLQKHIVFVCVFVVVGIFDTQDVVSETWNHEKLLVQTIHVTNAPEILYSNTTR